MRSRLAAWRLRIAVSTLAMLGVRLRELPLPSSPNPVPESSDLPLSAAQPYAIQGNRLLQEQRLEEALMAWTEAIRLEPQTSLLYSGRALVHLNALHIAEAIADCTSALRLDPANVEASQIRGMAYAEQKQFAAAEADFQTAYRLRPGAARSLSNLAWLRLLQRDQDVALRLARSALAIDPDDPTAHYVQGKVCAARRQTDLALTDYRAALDHWPNVHTPYGQRYYDDLTGYIERYT